MLLTKKTPLYISRDHYWLYSKDTLHNGSWDYSDPSSLFKNVLKKVHTRSFRFILGEGLSYVHTFPLAAENITEDIVKDHLSALIPESLTFHNFGWKLLTRFSDGVSLVQAFIVPAYLLNRLSSAARRENIAFDLVPVSAVLADETRQITSPHLIVWKSFELVCTIAYRGNAYHSEEISHNPGNKINSIIDLAAKEYRLRLGSAFTNWPDIDKFLRFPSKWSIQKVTLDPMNQAAKVKLGNDDDKVIEITPLNAEESASEPEPPAEKPSEPSPQPEKADTTPVVEDEKPADNAPPPEDPAPPPKRSSPRKKILLFFLAAVPVLGLTAATFFFVRSGKSMTFRKSEASSTPTPTSVSQPTPTPSPEAALDSYKIELLNGSGIAGEATKYQEKLEAAGFSVAKTGNADSYDYVDLQLTRKEAVPEDVIELIKKEFSGFDVFVEDTPLSPSSDFDISIIMGKPSE